MRLCVPCSECAFENPRGWVGCARCGALLGPRLRRPEDSTTLAREAVTAPPSPDSAQSELDADAKTAVFTPARAPEPGAEGDKPSRPPPPLDSRPLVGRDEVTKALNRVIEEAFAGKEARLCLLHGDVGAGRSRMLHRASELAARKADVAVHYAALRSPDEGPYAPLSRLLLERFGVTPASSPARVRVEMGELVADVLGLPSGGATEATHLIGHVAGVPFPDSAVLKELAPNELRKRAVAAVARFVAGEGARAPQLYLLDDVDGADEGAVELLSALLALNVPIALVATGRDALAELAPRLGHAERIATLPLSTLTAPDVEAMLRALVPDLLEVPAELPGMLMLRTGGNPQQLVEVVRGLEAAGVFEHGEGGTTVDTERLAQGALPTSLSDSLRARLSALPDEERTVVRDAAIIGERFWDGALLALRRSRAAASASALPALEVVSRSEDSLALESTLDALEAKGFIARLTEPTIPGFAELSFQYSRARALIYAEIEAEEARQAHAVVAQWFSLNAGYALEGHDALLGAQLELAGARSDAAAAFMRAALGERARMRTTTALGYAEKALTLIDPHNPPARIEAMHLRGSILGTLGRYDEALTVFHETARIAWSRAAFGRSAAALNRIARIHRERGELDHALEHLHEALALFRGIGDSRGVASSYDDMAQVHRMRGELEQALGAAEQALELRQESGDARARAVSLNTLGRIELDLKRYDSAETRFTKALELREALSDHEGAIQTRTALGQLAFRRGQIDAAIGIYDGALQVAREMNHQRFQAYLLSFLGVALLARGDIARAETALSDAKRVADVLGDLNALGDIERHIATLEQRKLEAPSAPA